MTKPDLLLLHGALGASEQFAPLIPLLEDHFTLHLLDFEGHGRAPVKERPFRIDHFTENALDYLDRGGIERTHIFGYSMGGYVACTLARSHPRRVVSVATLGTKFHWDEETAKRETALLDPQKIAAKVPHFAQQLTERHSAAGWEEVLTRTQDLLWSLPAQGGFGPGEAALIECPLRVIIGDRDSTVTQEETRSIFNALPRGEMEVLPGTPHAFERVSTSRLAYSLIEFFERNSV
jgi:pimeloyl-ACP methyl ester carboxylesterase